MVEWPSRWDARQPERSSPAGGTRAADAEPAPKAAGPASAVAPAPPPAPSSDVMELRRELHDLHLHQAELEGRYQELRVAHEHLQESRDQLADLYDFAPVVYLSVDADCRIVAANLTAAALFGRERGTLIGKYLSAMVASGQRAALKAHVESCMTRRARVETELSFVVRGRPVVTAQVTSVPAIDESGTVVGCKCVVTDISALKWSHQKLELLTHASALLAASVELPVSLTQLVGLAVPVLADVCILDLVTDTGELRREATAFADAQAGDRLQVLRSVAPRARGVAALARVLRSREPLLLAAAATTNLNGIEFDHDPLVKACAPSSLMYVPLVGRGDPVGVLTLIANTSGRSYTAADIDTVRDLAWRAAAAIERVRLYDQARRAISARDDLLSFVSHDLKNPLMGITLSVESMLRGAPGDERRRSAAQLRRVQRAAQQMRAMIEDLLDITSIEAGRLTVRTGFHDLGKVLEEAAELFASLAAAKGVALEITAPRSPVIVVCDRQRLLQVLTNLVDNAFKFTPAGGRVTIAARPEGEMALFSVSDTGPGIPPGVRPRIFERFGQAQETARQGRGLGLYIARGLIEGQHGRIWVDDNSDAGATFFFTLPLASSPDVNTLLPTMGAGATSGEDPTVRRR